MNLGYSRYGRFLGSPAAPISFFLYFTFATLISNSFFQFSAHAVLFDSEGQKVPDQDVFSDKVNFSNLNEHQEKLYAGIGQFNRSCTTTFLDVGGNDSSPAYIVTNGHCLGNRLRPQQIEVDVEFPYELKAQFHHFYPSGEETEKEFPAKKLAYGTMKGTDVALVELEATAGELKKEGVVPLKLARRKPILNEPVTMVGALISSFRILQNYVSNPRTNLPEKKLVSCQIFHQVQVHEGVDTGRSWDGHYGPASAYYQWKDTYQNNCSAIAGFSGSPLINAQGEIVALLNTGVDDNSYRQKDCTRSRPCEVNHQGETQVNLLRNYAVEARPLAGCFNERGEFDLGLELCHLERP